MIIKLSKSTFGGKGIYGLKEVWHNKLLNHTEHCKLPPLVASIICSRTHYLGSYVRLQLLNSFFCNEICRCKKTTKENKQCYGLNN